MQICWFGSGLIFQMVRVGWEGLTPKRIIHTCFNCTYRLRLLLVHFHNTLVHLYNLKLFTHCPFPSRAHTKLFTLVMTLWCPVDSSMDSILDYGQFPSYVYNFCGKIFNKILNGTFTLLHITLVTCVDFGNSGSIRFP